jgi:NTE family protein
MDQPNYVTGAKRTAAAEAKTVNLALQGGGSHGAFTWGVLDRLLEEEGVVFEGITGTSAGAVNAVVLADGLAAGGRQGAREALNAYWRKVSRLSSRGLRLPTPINKAMDFPLGFVFLTYFASPYQMNPLNYNPFKELLREAINFERVRRQTAVKLFLCATNVQTAKIKIFHGKDIGLEHLLASTCLPLLMQAVEVDGEYYWDGSYAGNPAIFPLVYDCTARDILMIHVTPAERPGVPTTSPAIMNRMQEISFNTALIREMRTIDRFNRLIDEDRLDGGKRLLVHLIEAEDLVRDVPWWSRLNADWDFLMHLHEIGRARAEEWLDDNFDRIGVESTVDLQEKYY